MKKGFTYIELLITLAIIAILFVPVMQLFSHSVYSSGTSQDLITAANLAKWQMERLKNLGYTKEQLQKIEENVYPPLDQPPLEMNNQKWRIIQDIPKEESGPLQVTVSVYRNGEAEPFITLVTLIEDMYWSEFIPIK